MSTPEKCTLFVDEPIGIEAVTELPWIGRTLAAQLNKQHYKYNFQLLEQFLVRHQDEGKFQDWLQLIVGKQNEEHITASSNALKQWCCEHGIQACSMSLPQHPTTGKYKKLFADTHLGLRLVDALPGIGRTSAAELNKQRYKYAFQLLGQFLVLHQNEQEFKEWLREIVPKKDTNHTIMLCSEALMQWCSIHGIQSSCTSPSHSLTAGGESAVSCSPCRDEELEEMKSSPSKPEQPKNTAVELVVLQGLGGENSTEQKPIVPVRKENDATLATKQKKRRVRKKARDKKPSLNIAGDAASVVEDSQQDINKITSQVHNGVISACRESTVSSTPPKAKEVEKFKAPSLSAPQEIANDTIPTVTRQNTARENTSHVRSNTPGPMSRKKKHPVKNPISLEEPVKEVPGIDHASAAKRFGRDNEYMTDKMQDFVNNPVGPNKPVNELPGIGDAMAAKLKAHHYEYAQQVLEKFKLLDQNEEKFQNWLCGILGEDNRRYAKQCSKALKEWFRIESCRAESPHLATVPKDWIKVGKIMYNPKEELGQGRNGTVIYKGIFDKRDVAVKRVLKTDDSYIWREIELLTESDHHPNIIRYFDAVENEPFSYIVLELCAGNFQDYLDGGKIKCDQSSTRLLHQAMSGIEHLHSRKIVHRDIKPQNVLISLPDQRGSCKAVIADLGLGKKNANGKSDITRTRGVAGTAGWAAPEMLTDFVERITEAVDIFSAGCLIYYVVTKGQHAFGEEGVIRDANILKNIPSFEALQKSKDEFLSDCTQDLVSGMIAKDGAKRPQAIEVLKHPFFWDVEKQLAFLCDVHKLISLPPENSKLIKQLQMKSTEVMRKDWKLRICPGLKNELKGGYDGKSLSELLRAIRNKTEHHSELPTEVQESLGPVPDCVRYFTSRFPKLLLHVYSTMRNEPALKQYY